eukprot:989557_1
MCDFVSFALSISFDLFVLYQGNLHFTVDAGITTFCNHGCGGKFNYGDDESEITEMTADLDEAPEKLLNKASNVYSPVFERHLRQITSVGDYTIRNIKAGEEILCNYLSFVGDPDLWEEDVTSLRRQCAEDAMGDIQEYESKFNEETVDSTIDGTFITSDNFTNRI